MNSTTPSNVTSSSDAKTKRLTKPVYQLQLSHEAVTAALYSTYHSIIAEPQEKGEEQTVFEILHTHLKEIDPQSWDRRAEFGGVHLNGRRILSDRTIHTRSLVEYYEPKYSIEAAGEFFPVITENEIIYRDEYLIVIFKPAGIPSTSSREQSHHTLRQEVQKITGQTPHLPSRLDASTAGLIVISIHPDMHDRLQRLFERRLIRKGYLATVENTPSNLSATIDAAIGKSDIHPVLREIDLESGDDAVTEYEVLSSHSDRTLIYAFPKTGRTHQLRVHLGSFLGPIDGDQFYGGRKTTDGLHLLSYSVEFHHPISGERIELTVPDRLMPDWARPEPES